MFSISGKETNFYVLKTRSINLLLHVKTEDHKKKKLKISCWGKYYYTLTLKVSIFPSYENKICQEVIVAIYLSPTSVCAAIGFRLTCVFYAKPFEVISQHLRQIKKNI